jgi:predicted nuclease with TOPRIM domain
MDTLKAKVGSLTQRLDHMVPDNKLTFKENRAAALELKAISETLFELLPDKSLSPFERLERLGRVAEPREPLLEELQPAHVKLKRLKARINELVPGEGSFHEKLVALEMKLEELVGDDLATETTIKKLEKIGDPRGGIEPE